MTSTLATISPLRQKRKLSQVTSLVESPFEKARKVFAANGVKDFDTAKIPFVSTTPEMIAAYTCDIVRVVRNNDIDGLKQLHSQGALLSCCNSFGESLLHIACRRSNTDIVKYLLNEAKVSPLIRDDYGRSPLHDACWTAEPNFELLELLIQQVPEFLCLKDVRGHTCFDYARKEHWQDWCRFIEEHRDLLKPKLSNKQ